MDDDEIKLCNACTDLVSVKKFEAFPLRLLGEHAAGAWVAVRDLCIRTGLLSDVSPDVFTTWLADPMGDGGYAVILFYDRESQWSMTAHFNRARLLPNAADTQATAAQAVLSSLTSATTHPASR